MEIKVYIAKKGAISHSMFKVGNNFGYVKNDVCKQVRNYLSQK